VIAYRIGDSSFELTYAPLSLCRGGEDEILHPFVERVG
jgi:hypothetical protein